MKAPIEKVRNLVAACSLSCVMMVFANPAGGDEVNEFSVLKKNFPSMIETEWHKSRVIGFCPDNTCERLTFSRQVRPKLAEQYALIYLFSVSQYWLLEDWRKRRDVVELVADAVYETPSEGCRDNQDLLKKSRCIIRELNRSGQLKVFSSRFDEGMNVISGKNELDTIK